MSSKVFKLIEKEKKRQLIGLEMIPSENYVSSDVLKALGSILTNKYSEGFPKARYYGGNEVIDKLEIYAQNLANKLFGTKYAFVQPYSGSPANFAATMAVCDPGDVVMGLALSSGGHLTHGANLSFSSIFYKAVNYTVGKDWKINFEELEDLAKKHKPKLIWAGTTAYPFKLDYSKFRKIADEVGAWLVADISHISGLIVGGVHPSPVKYVDLITTTTHKTLRGPRGAMILVTDRGYKKDPEIKGKIEKAIIPGLQGGPHNHQTAAIAVALEEALKPSFKRYAKQVVKNAAVLAAELGSKSENHLILLSLESYGYGMGYQGQVALEAAGITINKNTIPGEPVSPFYPSGIRLGTPALTSRGMKEKEMVKIAGWIKEVLEEIRGLDLPKEQELRKEFIKSVKVKMKKNPKLKKIRQEIAKFASKYPVPGIDS
ncbi:MAG: Serine hydroxymethyltransferase [Candidatus Daviesbacteria bacterium GW2011_GWA1_41_61]|uniref:Serine hydroxymethyltransferase n=1 Tax=Candidatus Daviesbacteria bacterium GW2011_GWA2_40_9 TaxID=1618424 RepID=A0A0G0U2B9_9BACT|nr:MAG: serine hydroxymethyltransferase, glycine hydroxymethyltransferase [Candidatus Daviesbacteria bacterium GW2011_GWC1_40_9]KKR83239.1 MAG: Serine hydroxymethyltransferase [Candidatus Daviesbacteria bacterium GW2011_GWA2_40_9]KKR93584.1 MAG: Serine hydroxymethyltransferase [Candidatus Daviesbacteria bacterium GW2011_GWB1_41_15]KKS14865.1 MAG: Serine hydroxymethyltransferase [Candidatus Daviesbacteria bacterium GW2011_GWA1_41_61]